MEGGFELRWFTPVTEVALCGHATLASAFVLFRRRGWTAPSITFRTRKSGDLMVTLRDDLISMDFPARPPSPQDPPKALSEALGVEPQEFFVSAEDALVLVEDEAIVRNLQPDIPALLRKPYRGTIVTAKGKSCDFVSRFFAPRVGVAEDPVTGSAHCVLTPYWSKRLGRKKLHAQQVSRRGGELFCEDRGTRIGIAGRAVLYLEGEITV
jgi:PhzF family phenazine biosynthesis protein